MTVEFGVLLPTREAVMSGRPETPPLLAMAERAERGEDVSAHFTNHHMAKQRVNIDFPLDLLRQIDAECQRIGVTRQAWIKMACDERLRQVTHSGIREDTPPKRHTE